MAAVDSVTSAARLPGPPELLPGRPDAIVDLQTDEGVAIVGGRWEAPLVWKVPLTYLVPFLVATWGALVNSRAR